MCEIMKLYNPYPNIKESKPLNIMGKVVLKDGSSNNDTFNFEEPLSSLCMNIINDNKVSSSNQKSNKDLQGDSQKKQLSLRKPVEEELCKICGDRASGYHYNALSCEGCKGFFRRSITRNAVYTCKYGGHCEMDMWMRRKCPACRLVRCREVGMKQECLLSDDQCKARDARRKAKKKLSKKPDTNIEEKTFTSPNDSLPNSDKLSSKILPIDVKNTDPLANLSQQQQELIKNLVYYQEKFEYPDESYINTIKNVSSVTTDKSQEELQSSMLEQMALICVFMTKLIIEFAKQLPGFQELPKEDQIVLLKEASNEVTTLRAARCYDPKNRTIVFMTGIPVTQENMSALGIKNYAEVAFGFFHSLSQLCTDNTEYALLTAICIFSERPGLKNPALVEKYQENFVSALYNYEHQKRNNGGCAFAILISRLTELRTISLKHSQDLLDLEMDRTFIPELVKEFFSIESKEETTSLV